MTIFDSRERAFEAKFAHDEEFRFLVTARRDKLLARQVAAKLNLQGSAGDDLTASFLAVRDGPGHDALLLDLVVGTFLDHGVVVERADAANWLQRCAGLAAEQLLSGQPPG
ncbi:MAG: DUF1476 domain-containing protein [Pseudomonadota bacterium]|nr:DUF1476 domain-containing protein [Pseudomonadota bacterium]